MKKYRVSESDMLDAYLDYMSKNEPATTKKTTIREFLVNGVLVFAAEDGRFDRIAALNGYHDYKIGNIKKAVDLIAETVALYIRRGWLYD